MSGGSDVRNGEKKPAPQYDVQMLPPGDLTPYARNPRKNAGAVAKVAMSILEAGFISPIIVDAQHVIIAGHTRRLAAIDLGLEFVPVHVADYLSPEKAAAHRLRDNRVGESAKWDADLLREEFADLNLAGVDLTVTGFDRIEWTKSLGQVGERLDAMSEWQGMPEFVQEDQQAFKTVKLHFADQKAVDDFAKLLGQSITPDTRWVWYPKQEQRQSAKLRRYESVA